LLNLFIAKQDVNLEKGLKSVLTLSDVKSSLTAYFENLQVADLFSELFEMDRNKGILDKQDFYLYFGEISFKGNRYPIFYIPVTVTRQEETMLLDFDSQVYINKRALEFIVQEQNALKGTKGNLKTATERIIYLAQHTDDLNDVLNGILTELTNFLEANGTVNFTSQEPMSARSPTVRISNACHLALFDKSDEALVNDYEEILQQLSNEDGILSAAFNALLTDFIHNNPESCNAVIEEEWDDLPTNERLVAPSPIPLNSEQLQILAAIRKENCKYLIVEGPPGTGKSHTITAIIFDAVLRHQSVLVLSDKKEALDVVEKNITQTMDKVRFDKNFQNPILRLGKTGNTYGQILSRTTIDAINTHYRAVKRDHETIEQNISKSINSLKEDIEAESLSYNDISLPEIREFYALEDELKSKKPPFDPDEMLDNAESLIELADLRTSLLQFRKLYQSDAFGDLLSLLGASRENIHSFKEYEDLLGFLTLVLESIVKVQDTFKEKLGALKLFDAFDRNDIEVLEGFIDEYRMNKRPVVGYLFNKDKVQAIDLRFVQQLRSRIASPHDALTELKDAHHIFAFIESVGKNADKNSKFDFVALMHRVLANEGYADMLKQIIESGKQVLVLDEFQKCNPKTVRTAGINLSKFETVLDNKLTNAEDLLFEKQLRYFGLRQKLASDFGAVPDLDYALRKQNIEDLVITQVTYELDGRVVHFYQQNKNDAETLRNIIKSKQRFPKEKFQKLKEAFPCILAGIRDYAEYIPLEGDMFDLVIIDEASQVSIAQAFPALLRAKKVLILGDKKQFSNVKAAQARSDTNREYLNTLEQSFRRNVSTDATKMVKLEKFNIKTSVLEFFEFITNYSTRLRKHFRGYKEIISYSNKYFYQEGLQVMKIRGKPIDEVIKFSFVEPKPEDEVYPNTNLKEVEFIIAELQRIKEEGSDVTVGIITPHTNQQKLLMERISSLPERDYYFDNLQLKIMTFDTCQGEERDIIFYSMVASAHSDRLWGVFIKDLNNVDIEEDGQIKAQRLNVGLSRGKECVHFVLSKSLEDFTGSIGDALRHYHYTLGEAKKEHAVSETDGKSKMEPEVLNWFYQTEFWKDNKDRIEFRPQFELGKYLKQLDRSYTHPEYKVDFLLIYRDEQHKEHKIIIEYDGFREHFKDLDTINRFNYQNYYSDGDVYRQKVLESYGYKFLRINRFNVGKNPIETLDKRLSQLVKDAPADNPLLHNIHETIEHIHNGEMKECPKCKQLRSREDFRDSTLITGYGRFCRQCKGTDRPVAPRPAPVLSDINCPRCGSKMILRNGRRGQFYGCSKFPYCRGTREYKKDRMPAIAY
jgi:very-short-patch-repair endonuclease